MAATVDPARILHELSELWTNLAHPDNSPATENGVLRACAMTLIVAAEDEADAQRAGEALAELIHDHPSRAIVLKPSGSGELEARVFAQCWMPFGRRQQICCEEIEIAAGTDRLGDVPGLMLGLLAPDLPVVLWCRGERWFAEPRFAQLLPLVDKLVVDSKRFADTGAAFALIGSLMGQGYRVADLTWSRLTVWREVIARAFDSQADIDRALATRSIVVRHGGAAPVAATYYLAAWLSYTLPAATVTLVPEPGGLEGIRGVQLDDVTFDRRADCTVAVRVGDSTHSAVLTKPDDCSAMREELGITRRDEIYERVYEIAGRLMRKG